MLEIKINHLIEGAKQSEGLAVIVDVLRVGTVITTLLNNGADHIVACSELEDSYSLKKQGYILLGERGGQPPPGFDYGNSPFSVFSKDFHGKKAAVNTQAGSQGIVAAANASDIIVGGFVNSAAVERYIQQQKPDIVTIVAMGYNGITEAIEDEEYARFLEARLRGQPTDHKAIVARIKQHESVQRFFDPANKTFPQEDFYLCTALNTYGCLPKVYQRQKLPILRDANNNPGSS